MRAFLSLSLLLLACLLPQAARAGEPTLGGTVGATRTEIVVDSSASVPVMVTLSVPDGWQIAESAFALEPGGHRVVEVLEAGEDGQVIARMVALAVPAGTDRSTLVLALGLPKPEGPPVLLAIGAALLVVVAGALIARRRLRKAH